MKERQLDDAAEDNEWMKQRWKGPSNGFPARGWGLELRARRDYPDNRWLKETLIS